MVELVRDCITFYRVLLYTMNKAKRRLRHIRNQNKDREQKQKSWEEGKLIYENHNNEYFSPEFSIKFLDRIVEKIKKGDTEFYKLKEHAINAILMFNPEVEKPEEWYYLKRKLEEYWDDK